MKTNNDIILDTNILVYGKKYANWYYLKTIICLKWLIPVPDKHKHTHSCRIPGTKKACLPNVSLHELSGHRHKKTFSHRHCKKMAFPQCESSYAALMSQTAGRKNHTSHKRRAVHQYVYAHVQSADPIVKMLLHNAGTCKVSHQCGLASELSVHLSGRRQNHTLYICVTSCHFCLSWHHICDVWELKNCLTAEGNLIKSLLKSIIYCIIMYFNILCLQLNLGNWLNSKLF